MTLTRLAPLALILLLVAGCDSSEPEVVTPPEPVRLTGRYGGSTNVGGIAFTINMTLNDVSGNVNGSGTLRSSNPVAISVTGSYVAPDFNLTFRNQGIPEDVNFAGTSNADATVLTGNLNGSGFDNVRIFLNKDGATRQRSDATVAPVEVPEGVTTFRELFESEAVR